MNIFSLMLFLSNILLKFLICCVFKYSASWIGDTVRSIGLIRGWKMSFSQTPSQLSIREFNFSSPPFSSSNNTFCNFSSSKENSSSSKEQQQTHMQIQNDQLTQLFQKEQFQHLQDRLPQEPHLQQQDQHEDGESDVQKPKDAHSSTLCLNTSSPVVQNIPTLEINSDSCPSLTSYSAPQISSETNLSSNAIYSPRLSSSTVPSDIISFSSSLLSSSVSSILHSSSFSTIPKQSSSFSQFTPSVSSHYLPFASSPCSKSTSHSPHVLLSTQTNTLFSTSKSTSISIFSSTFVSQSMPISSLSPSSQQSYIPKNKSSTLNMNKVENPFANFQKTGGYTLPSNSQTLPKGIRTSLFPNSETTTQPLHRFKSVDNARHSLPPSSPFHLPILLNSEQAAKRKRGIAFAGVNTMVPFQSKKDFLDRLGAFKVYEKTPYHNKEQCSHFFFFETIVFVGCVCLVFALRFLYLYILSSCAGEVSRDEKVKSISDRLNKLFLFASERGRLSSEFSLEESILLDRILLHSAFSSNANLKM